MARVPNPFRPGFNQAPAALAGRDVVLDGVEEALAVAAWDGRTPRPLVLTGGRGVGKTVLLGAAAELAAQRHGWLTVPVEIRAETPFRPQLIERLRAAADLYRQTPPEKRATVTAATFRASMLGLGGEVEVRRRAQPEAGPALPLDAALADACTAAIECGAGLVLTIDELQLATRAELGDLAATLQQHVPDAWPLVVLVAGLPSIRGAQRGVTYLERGEWHLLGLLDPDASRFALQEPAREAGRPMTDRAAAQLAEASGGYPFAIQLMGHHAWRASTGSTTVDLAHVAPAVGAAQTELATGLYASRWEEASPGEQDYLRHLADLTAGNARVTGTMVAAAMNTTTQALSVPRSRLIQKGLLYAEGNSIRFSVPGMAAWIRDSEPDVSR